MTDYPRPPDWVNPHKDVVAPNDGSGEIAGLIIASELAYEDGANAIYPFAKEEGRKEAISEVLAHDRVASLDAGSEITAMLETSAGMQPLVWKTENPGFLCFIPLKLKE